MPSTAFSSVKLPGALVERAREAAQPLRRSVASQIEYWATLGQVVEHTGLSVQEARAAIEQYESATRAIQAQAQVDAQASALADRFLAAELDGSLAQRVRDAIADNRGRVGLGRV